MKTYSDKSFSFIKIRWKMPMFCDQGPENNFETNEPDDLPEWSTLNIIFT